MNGPKLKGVLDMSDRYGQSALQVLRDIKAVENFAAPYATPIKRKASKL